MSELSREEIAELVERSEDDRAIIVGSEVRQLACMAEKWRVHEEAGAVPEERMKKLLDHEERLKAIMPLFQEARDAICHIPLRIARLVGLDLSLADRMDEVGVKEKWEKRKNGV